MAAQQSLQSNSRPAAGWTVVLGTAFIYFLLTRRHYYQDLSYTFTIASALLQGSLGVHHKLPWLNELVPMGDMYYSVFPLGAVLSVLPLSALVALHILGAYPVNLVVIFLAAVAAALTYALTGLHQMTPVHRVMLTSWLVFGTWFLTNMVFAGAWQLALGFAVAGQLGAIYFSTVSRRPLLAGLFFAVAIGNRTETALTAPILLAFLLQPYWAERVRHRDRLVRIGAKFLILPLVLGLATMWYNAARFGSVFDFGYAHIPGVLGEPWYAHGIFSIYAIPGNLYAMLLQPWHLLSHWPYVVPDGFGGSILLASPFLFLLLRRPARFGPYYWGSLIAVLLLTLALWCHGNPGGWQFSYRYALVLLPWFLLMLIEALPQRPSNLEIALWLLSLAVNAFATYLFLFTRYIPM